MTSYEKDKNKLTNEDFRKIFMTPRHPGGSSSSGGEFLVPQTPSGSAGGPPQTPGRSKKEGEKRKQKKQFFAKIKKDEDDQLAELAKKYRDRAKERREGEDPDALREEQLISSQGAYRAVAPDYRGNVDAAEHERRKQMIQESKFLGGDMEHTHLVKGLDYALLQKVKSELETKDEEDIFEDEEEEEKEKPEKRETALSKLKSSLDRHHKQVKPPGGLNSANSATVKQEKPAAPELQDTDTCKTTVGKNLMRVLFKSVIPERNELFAQGRMAYVMDLEDESAESDIPTTLIRSKADVPNLVGQATLTTNDIVINKLAQILSYLRSGGKHGKKHKKNKDAGKKVDYQEPSRKVPDEDIFGDVGEYVPTQTKSSSSRRHDRDRDRDSRDHRDHRGDRDHERRDRDRDYKKDKSNVVKSSSGTYFDKPIEDDGEIVLDQNLIPIPGAGAGESNSQGKKSESWMDGDSRRQGEQTFGSIVKKDDRSLSRKQKLMSKMYSQPEGYAECYPGFEEMHDALADSDEETDFSKMDPGKKKGTVGRWDFDTVEEYSDYMSNKEALPKAAFQFGVKMTDGRKTRSKGVKTEKQEKARLDRQWNQIQAIIQKRKDGPGTGKSDGEPPSKSAKIQGL